MECTICLLTEWTLKANELFEAYVFLIEKGAFVVVEDSAFHLEREFGKLKKALLMRIRDGLP